jgi:hypothetical protein
VTYALKNSMLVVLLALVAGGGVVVGCVHDTSSPASLRASLSSLPTTPPAASPIVDGPVVAVAGVDAPGYNVEDLTARLSRALSRTSGLVVVDEAGVRAELAACVEMPCVDTQQQRFREATILVGTTISKVGTTVLGSVRVSRGSKELARVNAQGTDAAVVVTTLGHEAGVALHATLSAGGQVPGPQRR